MRLADGIARGSLILAGAALGLLAGAVAAGVVAAMGLRADGTAGNIIWYSFLLAGGIPGAVMGARRGADHPSGANPPPAGPVVRSIRSAFCAAGLGSQIWMAAEEGLGGLRWFPSVGACLALISLMGAMTGERRAVVAMLPIAWTLLIVFLPAFGLGLFVAPVALATGAAAAVPDHRPVLTRNRVITAVLWAAIVILLAGGLFALSGPAPARG